MALYHDKLKQLDHNYLWHPFTQMQEWMAEDPCIISQGDGHFLVDHTNSVRLHFIEFIAPGVAS